MTPDERSLITGLFDRLRGADTHPKDTEAEQLIQSRVSEQPGATYLLAQTVLVQEHALTNAQARIAQLERQAASQAPAAQSGGGSFLSGLFGGGHSSAPAPAPAPAAPPYPSTVNMAPSSGGGFLRSALGVAAGVAGGSLLFQGIEGLLGHNAGVFGVSGFGGGNSFLGGNRPEIIENNYYEGGAQPGQGDFGAQTAGTGFLEDPQGSTDAPAYQEADYETPADDGSNYSDDSSSSDFNGGDDFSGGGSDDGGGLV